MITGMSHTQVWVLDQDSALDFYTKKLGLTLHDDVRLGPDGPRWLTVSAPDQPELRIVLSEASPPMLDPESAERLRALIAKGVLGAGVMSTGDCRATYAELASRGVTFVQEPAERPYGIEAVFRDDSGNWFSLTQQTAD
ncbi:VOC family protein [Allonocardiopsis opalescens]|uniref:Catechol 2,3-dioxygenase-like lactoylglutathione lyase family enzyme n=1 Tax=Allonocardiopsis opalescens TaxID=1144618 RepID=A0A2T0Q7K7_9ACTN|nr:VOC family protein [Allonocardiopsis opalescens]PRX99820.1 catechol 2,3-dioxygenase-like lactoylglutathione lyase family enzyme [Allonocardiopsis opalescens]